MYGHAFYNWVNILILQILTENILFASKGVKEWFNGGVITPPESRYVMDATVESLYSNILDLTWYHLWLFDVRWPFYVIMSYSSSSYITNHNLFVFLTMLALQWQDNSCRVLSTSCSDEKCSLLSPAKGTPIRIPTVGYYTVHNWRFYGCHEHTAAIRIH